MRELRLTAVSEDGAYLILSDGDVQFALRADERLHAAIRGDRARLGQLEIQLESQLRPRDIQARIRAGESVEAVAAAATMPLEKVRRFAGPVLAEREHVASRARQATVRRISGEGPVRTLETAAVDYAVSLGAQPESVTWDAWRADDGRWRVRCAWALGDPVPEQDAASPVQPGSAEPTESAATFSFDPSGRSVTAQDATARLVAGEPRLEPEPVPEPVPDPVSEAAPAEEPTPGPPRLSVVGEEPPAAAPDAERVRPAARAGERPHRPEPHEAPEHRPEYALEDDQPTSPIEPARRNRRAGRYGRPERRRREPELWNDQSHPDGQDDHPAEDDASTDRLRLSDIASHVEIDDGAANRRTRNEGDGERGHPHAGPSRETSDEDDGERVHQPSPVEDQPSVDEGEDLAPTAQDPPPVTKPRTPSRGSSKSKRPSVPSWDEIMFGRRKNE